MSAIFRPRIFFLTFSCSKLRRLKYTALMFAMSYNGVKSWYLTLLE